MREAEVSWNYVEEHQDACDTHQNEGADGQWRRPGA